MFPTSPFLSTDAHVQLFPYSEHYVLLSGTPPKCPPNRCFRSCLCHKWSSVPLSRFGYGPFPIWEGTVIFSGCKALTISGFAKVVTMMIMGFAYMAQNPLLDALSPSAQFLQTAGREVNETNIGKISDNSISCWEKLPGPGTAADKCREEKGRLWKCHCTLGNGNTLKPHSVPIGEMWKWKRQQKRASEVSLRSLTLN